MADEEEGRFRETKVFLSLDNQMALDIEVLRRRSNDEDRGPDGRRVNMNRSIIVRELIETHLPQPS